MADSHEASVSSLLRSRLRDLIFDWLDISDAWDPSLVGVHATGIEVTQAIQHYKAHEHLTDAADRGMDNSVKLIANKAAWVRVYVSSGAKASVLGVRGTLTVERRRYGWAYATVGTLDPQPPGMLTATNSFTYAQMRGSTTATLNFVIPADLFVGTLRLTVRLHDGAGNDYDSETVVVSPRLRQTLRVRGIMVAYNGPSTANPPAGTTAPNLTLAAPTLADLQTTAGLAMRMMPVQSTGSFMSAGTITFDRPLNDARTGAGACSMNWNALLTALANQRTADGNRGGVVYYGLLPAMLPVTVPGCGNDGLGSALAGNQTTFVHEIGHAYGFQHTPCGDAGETDPNYPTYEPYGAASIGEYGLDISTGQIHDPNVTEDYMSYCGPRWMSLYQHRRLIMQNGLDPRIVGEEEPWWDNWEVVNDLDIPELWLPDPPPDEPWSQVDRTPRPVISITGLVTHGRVEISTIARVAAAGAPAGRVTQLRAELLDEGGSVLAAGPLKRLAARGGCGCGCSDDDEQVEDTFSFQAFVPDVAPGAALRVVRRDGDELWNRDAPDRAPALDHFELETSDDTISAHWHVGEREERLEAWMQWSSDEGETWQALATGLTGHEAKLPLRGLPPGEVWVRVLLHDGFFTTVSDPARIAVRDQGPEIAVLHPREGERLAAEGTLHLWASAAQLSDEDRVDGDVFRWFLDDREVGRGRELWIEAPPAGEHEAVLVARGGERPVEQRVRFITLDPPRTYRG